MLVSFCGLLLAPCLLIIYRLYFHPLSKFPGPKLAAITSLYEFYFNVAKGGRYFWEIERMHEKYGPIVRISPQEVHISDPYYYTETYTGHTRKRDKDPKFTRMVGVPRSTAMTVDHDLHHSRRSSLARYFSRSSISKMQPTIQEKADKLAERLSVAHAKGAIITLDAAFSATTADIVSEFISGVSLGYLDDENFQNGIRDAILSSFSFCHVMKFFPFLLPVVERIPQQLVQRLSPMTASLFSFRKIIFDEAKSAFENGSHVGGRETMFQALCDPKIPPKERTLARFQDEAFTVLGAGTETTAGTLKLIFFHILHNKAILVKLRNEIQKHPHATLVELKNIMYMRGVINEGLRLSGIIARLPRIAPQETLMYKNWTIPPGAIISQSSYSIHMSPELFPSPHDFNPERWQSDDAREHLERLMVPFSKGSRQCLGMHLALADLYLLLATLVLRFDMDLYQTTLEDMSTYREYGHGFPRKENQGLRVVVTRDLSS
ncbi:hypothetical protein N7452_003243 [Penicillium brevicompactum]|uniref:Cytochrome P450 n=1 Tax=Penicillium brevicompactum TaxID=5074 RepID=A0A9W9QUN8_PENBR|nr:hypothetical protein N7452_003243 [Penicillium brevicompactum]